MRCARRICEISNARVQLVGESAAGHGYDGALQPGETARIFTGAPVPQGADFILLQEDAIVEGATIGATEAPVAGRHIRMAGLDFSDGAIALRAGTRLGPSELALAAASNHSQLAVVRKPRIAILTSGDELVAPGAVPGPAQIISCNSFAVAAIVEQTGGEAIDLGIFRDEIVELEKGFSLAREKHADVLVTLGGASVGDHDLLRPALAGQGMTLDFWRINMRPGKPLIHGRLGDMRILGLPGNPVAAIVCALVFLSPLVRALQGDAKAGEDKSEAAIAGADLPANKGRRDYMRAMLEKDFGRAYRRDAAAIAGLVASHRTCAIAGLAHPRARRAASQSRRQSEDPPSALQRLKRPATSCAGHFDYLQTGAPFTTTQCFAGAAGATARAGAGAAGGWNAAAGACIAAGGGPAGR